MKKVYSPIKDATDATKRQLAELIADRRPFVGVEPSEIIINKPLTFDTQGASMNFDLLFRNTGKSAAINTTSLGSELIITPLEVFSNSTHINYCNKDNATDFTNVGTIILPGGRSKYHINSIVPRTHFQFDPSGLVSAWFRLRIVYRDDEGTVHGTGFILFLETDDGSPRFAPTGAMKGEFKILSAGANVF